MDEIIKTESAANAAAQAAAEQPKKKGERLFCLDLLRGLDMFLLVCFGPLMGAAYRVWKFPQPIIKPFWHTHVGFSLWDLIMPLFIFMCGVAIPYALCKRLKDSGRAGWDFWKHVLLRVVGLWVLAMFSNGGAFSFDYSKTWLFNNTLQAIAAGYLLTAVTMVLPKTWMRFAFPVALFLVQAGFAHYYTSDYTRYDTTLALRAEYACIRFFQPGHDVWTGGYSWYYGIPMYGFMTACGYHCAEVLRSERTMWRKAIILFISAAVMLILGRVLIALGIPSRKSIWTASYVLLAMGWSILALSVLYVITDIWRLRRGLGLFILYGQFALTAYLLGETTFRSLVTHLGKKITVGLPHLLGTDRYQDLALKISAIFIITIVLLIRRKIKART